MKTVLKLRFVMPVFAIAVASVLAQSSKGDTIELCTGGDTSNVPCYKINLSVPGPDNHIESEFVPVSGNLSGLDPRGIGFGSSFAHANFGSVGAKTEVTDNSQVNLDVPVVAGANAEFDDFFHWSGGPGKLRFTLDLIGNAMAPADPQGLTFASAEAKLLLESSSGGSGSADIVDTGARIATATVDVGAGDLLFLDLNLTSGVALAVLGQGVSDFLDTAEITKIEQLDSSGNFLRDITLTDTSGNVLGAPAAAVPEPSTLVLMGTGLIAAGILAGAARRRAARQTRTC